MSPSDAVTRVLSVTVSKLTSEILIFLIGYTALVILLLLFSDDLAGWVQGILYFVPIVGVVGYIVTLRVKAAKGQFPGIRVRSKEASDSAEVIGVKGGKATDLMDSRVTVESGIARGKAKVIGVEQEASGTSNADEAYLLSIFDVLEDGSKGMLIARAIELRNTQSPHAEDRH
jgi:hypothetical protein